MPCTTVLVGKKAANDNSTMIARTDDGRFDVKKLVVMEPKDQKKTYTSVIGHLTIELPDNPLRCTACPSVDPKNGVWAATGINEANVGMTATETISSNPRVLAADPLVTFQKAKSKKEQDVPGGIGEEDFVVLVLPYIRTAREGVLRLAALLERYGTYESNGIAFNDENEIWWMETIGGHHWIAKRVPDDVVVVMPNQFGMDSFDFEDAFGKQEAHLCSKDLREFIETYHLDCNQGGAFNPRLVFGSHSDQDHVYNTPRAWYMGRYLAPRQYRWDGPDADFTPESDDIPWSFVPDRKIAVEEVKELLSSNYKGTPFDPYLNRDTGVRGKYRSIGINRTGVTSVCQIRPDAPDCAKGLEWICFGSTTFDALLPVYPNVPKMPKYLADVNLQSSTENFYWASRLIDALADHSYNETNQTVVSYQNRMLTEGRRIVLAYDRKLQKTGDAALCLEANDALAAMAKERTDKALTDILHASSVTMKNGYNRKDN